MEGKKFSEEIQEIVMAHGDNVAMDTMECVLWKMEHANCVDCPSELGCEKWLRLMLNMMTPMSYEPKSYEDFAKMQQRLLELQDRIFNTKTVEELRVVPKF